MVRRLGIWLAIAGARLLANWSMRRYARTRDDWFRELALLLYNIETRVRIFGEKKFPEWTPPPIPLRAYAEACARVKLGGRVDARDIPTIVEPRSTMRPVLMLDESERRT